MPVDFLTKTREQKYARFDEVPAAEQLTRHFYLNESDRDLIYSISVHPAWRLSPMTRLGYRPFSTGI